MKRFSFGNFLVDESNREAFELCQAVANLQPCSPMPVTLLADAECGKTHLLYSIVNRVRTTSAKTGLAYATAHDFPDQVRALIDDPTPVERSASAILLVDQLELFSHLVEELDAVIRIFLDHGHYVVLASNVHPGRLPNLSVGLRKLIESGRTVTMLPCPETRVEILTRQIRAKAEEELNRQREEIQELRTLLERVGKGARAADPDEAAALRVQLEIERKAREELGKKLSVAKAYCDGVQDELTSVRAQCETLQREAEQPREAFAQELAALRMQFEEERSAAASVVEENQRLRGEFDELSTLGEELLHLRNQFEALRAEKTAWESERAFLEASAAEKSAVEEYARTLQGQIEAERAEAAATAFELRQLRAEAEQLKSAQDEAERLRSRGDTLDAERMAALAACDSEHAQFEAVTEENARLRGEVDVSSRELEAAAAAGRRAREEANELLRRAEALITQIETNRTAFAEAEDERRRQIEELESMLAQRGSGLSADEWTALQAHAEELERTLESARSEAERERRVLEEALRQANDEFEAAGARFQEETVEALAARDHARAGYEQTLAAYEQVKAESAELRARYEQVESERDAFGAALQNAMDEWDALEEVSDQANAERTALRAAVDQIRLERDSLYASVEQLSEERKALTIALERVTREAGELRDALEQTAGEREALQREFEAAASERAALREHLERIGAENQLLSAGLEEARLELERNAAALESLRYEAAEQVAGANAQAGELEGRLSRLRLSFERADSTVKSAAADLDALKRELLSTAESLAHLSGGLACVMEDAVGQGPMRQTAAGFSAFSGDAGDDRGPFPLPEGAERAAGSPPDEEGGGVFLAGITLGGFADTRSERSEHQGDAALEPAELPVSRMHPLPELDALEDDSNAAI